MNKKIKKVMVVGITAITSFGMAVGLTACGADAAGKSAYDIAVDNGFTGTESEWLASLKGSNGANGADTVITIGEDGYWYINGAKTNTKAQGPKGADGEHQDLMVDSNGNWIIKGEPTTFPARGQSVFEIFVDATGYTGNTREWLNDYVMGKSAFKVWAEAQPVSGSASGASTINGYTTNDFFESVRGASAFEMWAVNQPAKPATGDGIVNGYTKDDYKVTEICSTDFSEWAAAQQSSGAHNAGTDIVNGYNVDDFLGNSAGSVKFGVWAETQPTKPREGADEVYGDAFINGHSISDFFTAITNQVKAISSVTAEDNGDNTVTYTINYTKGDPFVFTVSNGANGKSAFEIWAEAQTESGTRGDGDGTVNGYNAADFLNSLNGTFENRVAVLEEKVAELEKRMAKYDFMTENMGSANFRTVNGLIQQEVPLGGGTVWAYLYTDGDTTIPLEYYLDITEATPVLKQYAAAYGAEPAGFSTDYSGKNWSGVLTYSSGAFGTNESPIYGFLNHYTGSTHTGDFDLPVGATLDTFREMAAEYNIVVAGDDTTGTITYDSDITTANVKDFISAFNTAVSTEFLNKEFFRRTWTYAVSIINADTAPQYKLTITGMLDSEGSLIWEYWSDQATGGNGYMAMVHYELKTVDTSPSV